MKKFPNINIHVIHVYIYNKRKKRNENKVTGNSDHAFFFGTLEWTFTWNFVFLLISVGSLSSFPYPFFLPYFHIFI